MLNKEQSKKDYYALVTTGMFWEFYPELTGEWDKDKEQWLEIERVRLEKRTLPDNIAEYPLTPDECFTSACNEAQNTTHPTVLDLNDIDLFTPVGEPITAVDVLNRFEPEVLQFAYSMQEELYANSHKGDWKDFNNKDRIIEELFYHFEKIKSTIKKEEIKEYTADCANILMFLNYTYQNESK